MHRHATFHAGPTGPFGISRLDADAKLRRQERWSRSRTIYRDEGRRRGDRRGDRRRRRSHEGGGGFRHARSDHQGGVSDKTRRTAQPEALGRFTRQPHRLSVQPNQDQAAVRGFLAPGAPSTAHRNASQSHKVERPHGGPDQAMSAMFAHVAGSLDEPGQSRRRRVISRPAAGRSPSAAKFRRVGERTGRPGAPTSLRKPYGNGCPPRRRGAPAISRPTPPDAGYGQPRNGKRANGPNGPPSPAGPPPAPSRAVRATAAGLSPRP